MLCLVCHTAACALVTRSGGIWVPPCKITLGVTTVEAPGNLALLYYIMRMVCMVVIVVLQRWT
jgi:hypothetical protein